MKKALEKIFSKLPASVQAQVHKKYLKFWKPEIYKKNQLSRKFVNDEGYSLKGYVDLNCIYVRIPKCASQSIAKALFGNLGGGHRDISSYRLFFSSKEFDDFFKFTFVRNPWDRVVSAYLYHREHWPSSHFGTYVDFNSFVSDWINFENIHNNSHFRPQNKFICEKSGEIKVDFVGHLENIEVDFLEVTNKLGVNAMLKKKNKTNSKNKDFRIYYNDASAQIVANLYKKDIQLFDYDFDNSSFN